MHAMLLGLIVAVAGVAPLLATHTRYHYHALITSVGGFFFFSLCFYIGLPSLVWPNGGAIGICILLMWIAISAVLFSLGSYCKDAKISIFMSCVGIFIYVAIAGSGCSCFRANEYARLIGDFEEKEWTQDVQPANPKHIRLVPEELALFLADKQLAQAPGAIGSQFQIDRTRAVLQRINGELWWVVPLDYKGFRAWQATDAVPGYVMVHGDDPNHPPILKHQEKFVYTPNAYFWKNLKRHLWQNGYISKGLTDFMLEIDEDGKAWWVVTVFEPTISWWGEEVTGIVMVDPKSGEHRFYSRDEIPSWVDRAVPGKFVAYYIKEWGQYQQGWRNSVWAHNNIVQPETPSIVYGSDGDAYWAVGITSSNNADESLLGLFYVNSRTGKTVKYHAVGATDDAVLTVTNNKVAYKKWHGQSPTLYNIYGVMTSVVPLLGESHTYQGVALVRVDNQQVVEAANLTDALREYQKLLGGSGNQVAPETVHDLKTVSGKVARFAVDTRGGNSLYYLMIGETPYLFTGGSDELASPKLPLTSSGDIVTISFIDSGEDVVPMRKFDNTSITLRQAKGQAEVRARETERQLDETVKKDAHDALDELGRLGNGELQELMKLRREIRGKVQAGAKSDQ